MNEKQNTKNASTPYDDASRTMLTDCSKLIIPVVNEAFHKQHGVRETVTLFQNEFFFTLPNSEQAERITDSNFAIGSVRYHLEFQSTSDGSIMWRVFEYDSQLALKDSDWNESKLTVRFPNTALIYLRHTSKTPNTMQMQLEVPGDSCSYDIPILKVQNYSLDEIFAKKLFFLLPFHLLTYEKEFQIYEVNETKREELMQHYGDLMTRLDTSVQADDLNVYEKNTIIAMMKKIMKHLLKRYSKLEEGLGDIMGGKVLDYEAKDILNRGIEEGKKAEAMENAKELFRHGASYELVRASIKVLSDEELQKIYQSEKNRRV